MRALYLAAGAVLIAGLMTGCGRDERDMSLPPMTAEPDSPLFATPSSSASVRARTVLQRFLRGAGSGDPSVCRTTLTAAYSRKTFARAGGCAAWIAALSADDRARLKTAEVPTATPGDDASVYVVASEDLVWPGGAPAAITAPRFVLRLTGGRWLLSL